MPLSNVTGAASLSRPGVCTSTTRPASPYDGQMIYETDTDKAAVWDGVSWVYKTAAIAPLSVGMTLRQAIQEQTTQITVNTTTRTNIVSRTFNVTTNGATLVCSFTADANANNNGDWKYIGWFLNEVEQHFVISTNTTAAFQEVVGMTTIFTNVSAGSTTVAVKAWNGQGSTSFAEAGGNHKNTLVILEYA